MSRPTKSSGLLSLRTALVLLLAVLAAATLCGLTWYSRHNAAAAAVVGLTALAGGAKFFDWLIALRHYIDHIGGSVPRERSGGFDTGAAAVRLPAIGRHSRPTAGARWSRREGSPCQIRR